MELVRARLLGDFPLFHLQIVVKRGMAVVYRVTPHCAGAMPHVHHSTSYASAARATSALVDQTLTAEE